MKKDSIWIEGFKLWPLVFKRAWPWLIFTALISIGFDSVLETLRKVDDRLALAIGLVSLVITLFLEAFSTIIISQIVLDARKKVASSLQEAVNVNLKPVFIETTRALVPILLKSLLLIIPGLIEAVRLFFVAYVVQFDDEYKTGKVDALERSRELVKGHVWQVTSVLIITFILTAGAGLFRSHLSFLSETLFYFLALAVGMATDAYADTVLYLLYERNKAA
jgi:hypothetical protein